jgi:hypothetical protein
MNRTRRTALTATIAAAIIGGASAVVAANAAEPTAGPKTSAVATSSPTPSATSSTNPVEDQLRDEIAALELVATLATDDTTTLPSSTATRTAAGVDRHGASSGPGSGSADDIGVEDGGVHQHRNRGGDDADDIGDDGGHHNGGDDNSGHDGHDDSGDDD